MWRRGREDAAEEEGGLDLVEGEVRTGGVDPRQHAADAYGLTRRPIFHVLHARAVPDRVAHLHEAASLDVGARVALVAAVDSVVGGLRGRGGRLVAATERIPQLPSPTVGTSDGVRHAMGPLHFIGGSLRRLRLQPVNGVLEVDQLEEVCRVLGQRVGCVRVGLARARLRRHCRTPHGPFRRAAMRPFHAATVAKSCGASPSAAGSASVETAPQKASTATAVAVNSYTASSAGVRRLAASLAGHMAW